MKPEIPVEEIWRIRDQLGAEEDYDVHRLFERLRREQQQFADRLLQPPREAGCPICNGPAGGTTSR